MKITRRIKDLIRRGGSGMTGLAKTRLLVCAAVAGASILMLPSCEVINEDLPPCVPRHNTFTKIQFVYDYNMLGYDLVNEHVGTVHLYVFNEDSVFLFDNALSRNDMTGPKVDFTMTYDTTYFKQGMKYLLVAMAQGNHSGYEWSTVVTPGFQIPLEYQMVPGVSKISDYRIMLDRDSDSYADLGIVNYKDAYGNNNEMLDTLWSTKPNQVQTADIPLVEYAPSPYPEPDDTVRVTIPLMRITNAVKVNLVHSSFSENSDVNRYNILIDFPNGNGTIGFTGKTFPNRELFYRSLRKEMTEYQQKQNGAIYQPDAPQSKSGEYFDGPNSRATQYSIKSTFGVSRLQTTDGSSLQVRDAETNEIIVQIGSIEGKSFSQWLADYFNTYYGDQEFLDREYDFTVDIILGDDFLPVYVQAGCHILGWGKRIHYYDL